MHAMKICHPSSIEPDVSLAAAVLSEPSV